MWVVDFVLYFYNGKKERKLQKKCEKKNKKSKIRQIKGNDPRTEEKFKSNGICICFDLFGRKKERICCSLWPFLLFWNTEKKRHFNWLWCMCAVADTRIFVYFVHSPSLNVCYRLKFSHQFHMKRGEQKGLKITRKTIIIPSFEWKCKQRKN